MNLLFYEISDTTAIVVYEANMKDYDGFRVNWIFCFGRTNWYQYWHVSCQIIS